MCICIYMLYQRCEYGASANDGKCETIFIQITHNENIMKRKLLIKTLRTFNGNTRESSSEKKKKTAPRETREREQERKNCAKKMCFRTLDCRFNNYKAMFKKVYSISTERTGITRAGQLLNFVP